MKLNWNEFPSVTTGGKPSFYNARTCGHLLTVVWDRLQRMWTAQVDHRDIASFDSKEEAMKALEWRFE
jgi:hypothetical protein